MNGARTYEPSFVASELKRRFPDAEASEIDELSEVWCRAIERILEGVHSHASQHFAVLPIEIREEVAFEWARVSHWITNTFLDSKLTGHVPTDISAEAEKTRLETESEERKLDTTAYNIAVGEWIPTVERLVAPHRTISTRSVQPSSKLNDPELPVVARNHFTPVFSQRYWATGPNNRVRVYSRDLDGTITSRETGFRAWGMEKYLYSAATERWLGLIETDGAEPYRKLLDVVPLDGQGRQQWVALLLSQILRMPTAAIRLTSRLKAIVETMTGAEWTDVGSLRRGYELLLRDNNIYAVFFRRLVGHKWTLVSAIDGSEFIRSDVPVRVDRGPGGWSLIYPMTPTKCFIAGPTPNPDPSRIVPYYEDATPNVVDSINSVCAAGARRSVISTADTDVTRLSTLLEDCLATDHDRSSPGFLFGEFWGEIGRR